MVAHIVLVGEGHGGADGNDQDVRIERDVLLDHREPPRKRDRPIGDAAGRFYGDDDVGNGLAVLVDEPQFQVAGVRDAGRECEGRGDRQA